MLLREGADLSIQDIKARAQLAFSRAISPCDPYIYRAALRLSLRACTACQPYPPSSAATVASSRSSRFGPRYGIAVSLLCGVVFHVALQEVAAAAENKRIFSPLSGPLVAPQGEASSEEWALDVVAKGNAVVVCLVQVLQARFEADGLAGFREFQVGDASTGRQ
jgi:hypothetical protein